MKKTFVISVLALLLLASCGQTEKPKEMYCGIGMSAFEVIDAKTLAANFKYSEEDKVLLGEVTKAVTAIDTTKKIDVYFFNHKPEEIGVYVVAPDDKGLVEKISCNILKSTITGLPVNRKVVFYTNDHNNLVAAVKTKPAETK